MRKFLLILSFISGLAYGQTPMKLLIQKKANNGYYRSLTLDQPASDLTNFPVLFSGTYSYLKTIGNGGKVNNGSGYDITFYSDAALTTLLKFERVFWDATTGTVEFWVKVPTLASASATVIYLAYGNPAISTDQQDAVNTWDANFKAVYHLPDGTTLSANDSKGVNNGTVNSVIAATGKIDGAGNGNGGNNNITIGTDASLNITSDITMSAWIKTNTSGTECLIGAAQASFPYPGYQLDIGVITAGKMAYYSGFAIAWVESNSTFNDNAWHHVAVVYSSNVATFYKDGSADGTPVAGAPSSYSGSRSIFNSSDNSSFPWQQLADEVHIAATSRSATWIATEYSNQNDPANFYVIGSETPA